MAALTASGLPVFGAAAPFLRADGLHAFRISSGTTGLATNGEMVFGLPALGGGATYNVSITEAASAVDSSTAALIAAASITESGSATDSQSVVAQFVASLTEAATATDTQSAGAVFAASVSEAASAADTSTALAVFLATVSEAASAVDLATATVATTQSASIAEAAAALDSAIAAILGRPADLYISVAKPRERLELGEFRVRSRPAALRQRAFVARQRKRRS